MPASLVAPPCNPSEPSKVFLFNFSKAPNLDELLRSLVDTGKFSDTFVISRVRADHHVALISLDGENVVLAGLFSCGNRLVTGKNRVRFEHLARMPHPLPLKGVLRRMMLKKADIDTASRLADPYVEGAGGIVPLQSWVCKTYPDSWELVRQLENLRKRLLNKRSDPRYLALSEQRDAAGLLLDIAGFDRREILSKCGVDAENRPSNFIECLPQTGRFDERELLEHDMSVFGHWTPETPFYSGTRRYVDEKSRASVTLMCVDRSKVEAAVGVDLIYYFDRFQSFVMVQYKRFDDKREYRPDARCRDQTERMRLAYETIRQPEEMGCGNLPESSVRLSQNPFFMKVCESEVPIEHSPSLVEGMYFPLEHWLSVLRRPEQRGPNGGVIVSRENTPRWLSNTEFVEVARKGWVGTTKRAGRHWVRSLIDAQCRSGQALILGRLSQADARQNDLFH